MMSKKAYDIAGCLATSAFSLHDLLATMLHVEHMPRREVDKHLHDGLRELAAHGWIQWTFEPDYGNLPAEKPSRCDAERFDLDWERCTWRRPLQEGVPDAGNPTMLIEATEALVEELQKPEYRGLTGTL